MDEPAGGLFQVTSSASAMLRMVLESHTLCESSRPVKADVPLTRNSTACPIALLNHLPEVPDLATPAGALLGCPETLVYWNALDLIPNLGQ